MPVSMFHRLLVRMKSIWFNTTLLLFILTVLYGPVAGTLPGVLCPFDGAPEGNIDVGGRFNGSSNMFWSTGVIVVVGKACCPSNQLDRALYWSVCNMLGSTLRDGSIPII